MASSLTAVADVPRRTVRYLDVVYEIRPLPGDEFDIYLAGKHLAHVIWIGGMVQATAKPPHGTALDVPAYTVVAQEWRRATTT
jgi:hypothetical protein